MGMQTNSFLQESQTSLAWTNKATVFTLLRKSTYEWLN